MQIAKKIVLDNESIFGEGNHQIKEINAGFNNDIFEVDNNYIIKICSQEKLEEAFLREANFYKEKNSVDYLPKFYKYDDSKKSVPFIYEIMERIPGKTLYYYWYKMSENEREETICKLVDILRDLHTLADSKLDWNKSISDRIKIAYLETKMLFSEEERLIIEESFKTYNKYLYQCDLVYIHNDLHFDNIIFDKGNLRLIDFNDCSIGPVDFDLRLLYMCQSVPWKWANSEMDPLQKPDDYKNIIVYLKKYYKKFGEVKFLNERMTIYSVLNDIELLIRFSDNLDLRKNIVKLSKSLIEK